MTENNPYSTHLEFLDAIFKIKGKLQTAIEFGMGNFSTKFLIENVEKTISIEMQSTEWYNNMVQQFGDRLNWKHHLLLGPSEYLKIQYPDQINLAFVDGHGDSRPECINFMMEKECPIILAHDTEEPGYRWNLVNTNNNYKTIVFKKYSNWTTLWTTDIELLNKLNYLQ